MKKSVFLAYAEDSDEDDAVVSHRQDDKSAKSSKQKQKQKAKKQEENALKSLAMTTSSKKSKKKKNQTHSTVAVDTVDEVVQAVEQVSVVDVPPSAVVAPASSYARASAALGTKNEAVGSPQSPPPVHAAQSSAPPPPPQKQPHTKQQPKPSSTPQRRQPTSSQVPTPPQAQQRDLPKKDKYIPPSLRNSTPAVPSPQPSQEHQWTSPERVDSPPPRSGPSLSGVTYVPAHITVMLPGQPDQVLEVEQVMARAQYFKQTAESLVTVNRNGQAENRQLREHLAQALARLEQVQHENRVLHQLNLNLQTEVASLRIPVFNPDPQAAAAIRPPGL